MWQSGVVVLVSGMLGGDSEDAVEKGREVGWHVRKITGKAGEQVPFWNVVRARQGRSSICEAISTHRTQSSYGGRPSIGRKRES
ncbi:hypothetical protein GALMADRAFT_231474 [Galerina marginata CBS 339.88]|uniref:Uncharacterized protein n=1 Tax=Galerina marginata (strain CBS 339.88) TaxID=685588 RepID=A0A067SKN8_GALM3|nr:hypothetical protein GALMADRAFT_231474 [Galerina marginata CBS 339.88]